jgi:hypothetical protein
MWKSGCVQWEIKVNVHLFFFHLNISLPSFLFSWRQSFSAHVGSLVFSGIVLTLSNPMQVTLCFV